MTREHFTRLVAGLLALLAAAALTAMVAVGGLSAITTGPTAFFSRLLGMALGTTILSTYAIGGPSKTFPRVDHLVWITNFSGRIWARIVGGDEPAALAWDASVRDLDRLVDPSRQSRPDLPEADPSEAGRLLAMRDEVDRLRELPSAVGLPGALLFLALVLLVVVPTHLGLLTTLGASLLIASPGVVLVAKDLKRKRRLNALERMLGTTEALPGPDANDESELKAGE